MPDNIIRPFLEGNMLQLILLAVMIGLAVGALDARAVRGILDKAEEIIMRITAFLMRFTPVMVFCSFTSLVLTTGTQTLLSLLQIVVAILAGYLTLAVVYCPLIACSGA